MRRRRLGLRTRITITFSLGSLLLSSLLAGAIYLVTRTTLLRDREDALVAQAFVNAGLVLDRLSTPGAEVADIVEDLTTPTGSSPIVVRGETAFPKSVRFPEAALQRELRERIGENRPAVMRYRNPIDDTPVLAVGILLPSVNAAYYDILPLADVDDSLRTIGLGLMASAGLTTVLGMTLGLWASRRTTRPLAETARAAQSIADGSLDTRLERPRDKDLRRLSDAFNGMVEALQTRIERDARFASDVSHELRSPLMTLAASVEVLESRRDELSDRGRAALDLVGAEVVRFQGLVEDLLEISRFDAGAVRLHLEDVLVAELIPNAVRAATDDPVLVVVEPEVADAIVQVDKRRMVQVIANLIDNARTHGGGATKVSVVPGERTKNGKRAKVEAVRIVVEDEGPGVPNEERTVIFERFARGVTAGRRGRNEGAGLGLALVDEHVRLHRGRAWVGDRPDGRAGACFTIELPVVEL